MDNKAIGKALMNAYKMAKALPRNSEEMSKLIQVANEHVKILRESKDLNPAIIPSLSCALGIYKSSVLKENDVDIISGLVSKCINTIPNEEQFISKEMISNLLDSYIRLKAYRKAANLINKYKFEELDELMAGNLLRLACLSGLIKVDRVLDELKKQQFPLSESMLCTLVKYYCETGNYIKGKKYYDELKIVCRNVEGFDSMIEFCCKFRMKDEIENLSGNPNFVLTSMSFGRILMYSMIHDSELFERTRNQLIQSGTSIPTRIMNEMLLHLPSELTPQIFELAKELRVYPDHHTMNIRLTAAVESRNFYDVISLLEEYKSIPRTLKTYEIIIQALIEFEKKDLFLKLKDELECEDMGHVKLLLEGFIAFDMRDDVEKTVNKVQMAPNNRLKVYNLMIGYSYLDPFKLDALVKQNMKNGAYLHVLIKCCAVNPPKFDSMIESYISPKVLKSQVSFGALVEALKLFVKMQDLERATMVLCKLKALTAQKYHNTHYYEALLSYHLLLDNDVIFDELVEEANSKNVKLRADFYNAFMEKNGPSKYILKMMDDSKTSFNRATFKLLLDKETEPEVYAMWLKIASSKGYSFDKEI